MKLALALLLAAAVITYTNAANITPQDAVKDTVDKLAEGSTISTNLMKKSKEVVQKVDETIKKAERKMQELTDKIGSVGVRANKVTGIAFEKYDQVKRDMRNARRKLRSLADKTKIACADLEIYLEGWDNEVDNGDKRLYLKEQLTIMEDLMKESLQLLEEAEKKYQSAVDNIEGVNIKLRDFDRDLKKMLDENSAEYDTWTTELRTGVYAAAGSVTVGMIIADVFGCLGICSAVGNAVAWGPSIAAVETSIAQVASKFEELENIGSSIKEDIGDIKTQTGDLIKVLENELAIVASWKNNVQQLDRRLDTLNLDKFERLPLYRKTFLRAIIALRESAEEYLKQPIELFTLNKK